MTRSRRISIIAAAAAALSGGAACGDSKTVSTTDDKKTLPATPVSPEAPGDDTDDSAIDAPPFPVDRPGRVGLLVPNSGRSPTHPGEYCLEDGMLYRGAPGRIAGMNVFGDGIVELSGAIVVAYGETEPSLLDALEEIGPCPDDGGPPEVQMRSDWVAPEGGSNPTKAKLAEIAYVRATSLHELRLHEVVERDDGGTNDDDTAAIVLHNPFDAALDGLHARVHYEGGPGKPMPMFRPLVVELPPGETQRIEVPAAIEGGPAGRDHGEPRGIYRLHSIDLQGRVGELVFDAVLFAEPARPGAKRKRKPRARDGCCQKP